MGLGNNFGETNTGMQMQGMTVVGQQMPLSPLGGDPAQLHAMAMEQQHYDNMVSACLLRLLSCIHNLRLVDKQPATAYLFSHFGRVLAGNGHAADGYATDGYAADGYATNGPT